MTYLPHIFLLFSWLLFWVLSKGEISCTEAPSNQKEQCLGEEEAWPHAAPMVENTSFQSLLAQTLDLGLPLLHKMSCHPKFSRIQRCKYKLWLSYVGTVSCKLDFIHWPDTRDQSLACVCLCLVLTINYNDAEFICISFQRACIPILPHPLYFSSLV